VVIATLPKKEKRYDQSFMAHKWLKDEHRDASHFALKDSDFGTHIESIRRVVASAVPYLVNSWPVFSVTVSDRVIYCS
jgi:hypothetical protein